MTRLKDFISTEPEDELIEKVSELQRTLAVVDKLSELEHAVAEAAISVRKFNTTPAPSDSTHKEWWDEYQRLFAIRIYTEDELIKFKEEIQTQQANKETE